MANAADMTTVERAAGRLRVSTSDTELPALITAASKALARHLGYTVERRTGVEESVVGRGGVYLFLRAGAVQSITSITVGGSAVDSSLCALDGEPGALMGRIVARGGHRWPFTGEATAGVSSTPYRAYDTGELIVTFTAGWWTPGQVALGQNGSSTLPEDLEQACVETVTAWYRRTGHDPDVTSRSTGDASVSYGSAGRTAIPTVAQELARPYVKSTRRPF